MAAKSDEVSERPSLRVHLPQRQRCFHSFRSFFRAEIVLTVQRAVKARNHLQRKSAELVILPAAHGYQLFFGHTIGPQHVLGALRPDDRGMSLERDVRNIQDMVVMCVRDEDKVGALGVCVDGRYVRRSYIIPSIYRPRVARCSSIWGSPRWLWPKYSRYIGINQNDRGSVADFPA